MHARHKNLFFPVEHDESLLVITAEKWMYSKHKAKKLKKHVYQIKTREKNSNQHIRTNEIIIMYVEEK